MTSLTTASMFLALSTAVALTGGCKKDEARPQASTPGSTQPAPAKGDVHPNQVAIGEATANGLTFKALQDDPAKPGGEAAFDLRVAGYPAGGKPKAVRFWVGTEAGNGSVKAKAEEEKPDNWHTHVEVPNPLPPGSKFWAEVEPAAGERFKVSFDLRKQ